jgi:hypothetical protein
MSDTHGTLILIQGLAGSGKSHLIELLRYDFLIQENFAATAESEERNIEDLARELRAGRRCIISERKYRSRIERDKFIYRVLSALYPSPQPIIRLICFENDIEAANHNCLKRTNKEHDPTGVDHVALNNMDTKDYEIPSSAIVIKIHRIGVAT